MLADGARLLARLALLAILSELALLDATLLATDSGVGSLTIGGERPRRGPITFGGEGDGDRGDGVAARFRGRPRRARGS